MSTPFEFFRRHQKVALAAVTGAAVLSFVVFDTSGNGDLSPTGLAVLVVGCFAIVGWIWGAGEGKSGENAIFGGVLGLAISLIFMFLSRPPAAISATTGSITTDDLQDLEQRRLLANRMVNLVYYRANPDAGFMAQFQLPQYLFSFGSNIPSEEALTSELLSREAESLGIQVTDAAAMDFLKQVAGKDKDGKDQLTQKVFREAIAGTAGLFGNGPGNRVNEDRIIEAIRQEMRASQAAKVLLGGNRMTPVDVWDLHRKLNTRQSAQFVAIPVQDFVDKSVLPTEADLKQTFETYKKNFPNTTPESTLEEGRPGLYLPRRVRLAYVEPVYEEVEKLAGEITEEEIQARYEEKYKKAMPKDPIHGGLDFPDTPPLPSTPATPEGTPDPVVPTTEKPADPAAPAEEKPADPAQPDPEKSDKPAEPAPPAESKPEASTPDSKPAEPATPPAEEQPAEPAAKPEGSSSRTRTSQLQPVVLIQDQPAPETQKAAEAPADPVAEGEKPAAPATTEEKPAEEKPAEEKPAEEKPAEEKPTEEEPAEAPLTVPPVDGTDADGDVVPPVSKVRPLTEELRQEIRDDLLRERTRPLLEEKMNAARDFMNELHLGVAEYLEHQRAKEGEKIELSKEALPPEEAVKRLQAYAEKNGLVYAETSLLALEELLQSDDYRLLAGALVQRQGRVIDMVNQSQETDLYSAMTAYDLDLKGSFAYWKIEDVPSHEPQSMDEPGVKEKVTQVWRTLQARPLAEKRAQELADIIAKSDKPVAEALGEQTVTGIKDKSIFVTVKSTGEFSWLQRSTTPQQFGGDNSPRMGAIDGVEGAGDSFMNKVFNEMQPGVPAVVPNFDRSVFYVTRIDKRSPGTAAEIEVMRKQFLESQGDLSRYARQRSGALDGNFAERLKVKHGVKRSRLVDDSKN